jgi:type II secretory ATPase GspE/PulE/Tfp pilus assembly ATPase PilB-like protein
MRFGEHLVLKNMVTAEAIAEAIAVQRYKKAPLGRLLRELGHIDQNTLNLELSSFLKLKLKEPLPEILARLSTAAIIPEVSSWLYAQGLIAIGSEGRILHAVSDRFQDEIIENFEKKWRWRLDVKIVEAHIYEYLRNQTGSASGKESQSHLVLAEKVTDDLKLKSDNPYARLFRECIETAKQRSISDVHIEPKADSLEIRFRIHGDLVTWKALEKEHRDAFITKVKWLTNLDLSISGKPQDARATYYELKLNLRVNALPSRHGDKIVLRLLDQEREFRIDESGLQPKPLEDLRAAAELKNGLIIISGPTGSGKTTTLYGLINSLDHKTKNITTLEDPSEYELFGVTQTEISRHLSFAAALRALMRQDPDVILLGEIRDEETAKLSFKIANTGHLVISTLHANGAIESIERLKTLGVDDFSVSSSLRFTGAQRLVKKLCEHCSVPVITGATRPSYLEKLKPMEETLQEKPKFRTRNIEGCEKCIGGISGRIPILEYASGEGVAAYLNGKSRKECLQTSLQEAAFSLAAQGLIDLEEAFHVA